MTRGRYAIYYAPPPGSPLWTFGSRVLGYDAATAEPVPALTPEGVAPDAWAALTAAPRRYGFHATLKAPFRLAADRSEDDLVAAGRAFARRRKAFALPELEVVALGSFVALSVAERTPALDDLAGACVEAFEPFRAPINAAETARRLETPLNERQMAALERWGYPYVFDDFHFHMTLTGGLKPDAIEPMRRQLADLYADHVGPSVATVDAVTLYVEDRPGADFTIVDRFAFGAGG